MCVLSSLILLDPKPSPLCDDAAAPQDDFFFGPEWQAEHQRRLAKRRVDAVKVHRRDRPARIVNAVLAKKGHTPTNALMPLEPLDGSPWEPFGPAWQFQDALRRTSRRQLTA